MSLRKGCKENLTDNCDNCQCKTCVNEYCKRIINEYHVHIVDQPGYQETFDCHITRMCHAHCDWIRFITLNEKQRKLLRTISI